MTRQPNSLSSTAPSTAGRKEHGCTIRHSFGERPETLIPSNGYLEAFLYLGELHDETAQALLFQNFKGPLIATDHVQIFPDEDPPYFYFKVGFLLPHEIRNSQIIPATSSLIILHAPEELQCGGMI